MSVTASVLVTIVMTISTSLTASAADGATMAPWSESSLATSRLRFHTTVSMPRRNAQPAMARPIVPRPSTASLGVVSMVNASSNRDEGSVECPGTNRRCRPSEGDPSPDLRLALAHPNLRLQDKEHEHLGRVHCLRVYQQLGLDLRNTYAFYRRVYAGRISANPIVPGN